MSSKNNVVEFDLSQVKDIIRYIIRVNRENREKNIHKKVAVEMIGDAGLGKTSAALQLAKEMGMELCKLNLAQIEEIGDLVGYPIKKYFIRRRITGSDNFESKMVAESQLKAWFAAGWEPVDKDPVMSYAAPEWIANRGPSGILLLDDWSRADIRFIQAVMDLIDRSEYISWKLPPDWHIILTSNPDNGEYIVNTLDVAQSTRYLTCGIKYNEKIWAEWAENNNIDSRCINFMLLNPEAVTGVKDGKGNITRQPANPRQWVNFFLTIGSLKDYQDADNIRRIETLGQMSIGNDLTSTFIQFIHNNMDKLPNPEFMIMEVSEEKVLSSIKECLGTGTKYRGDIASVLAIRFSNWLIRYANDNPITDRIIERMHNIVTSEVFGADLSYSIAKKVYFNHRQKFLKLVSKDTFMKYILVTK